MNFYAFHLGDYMSATAHLSWDEDMAYRRLLDAYYSREAPLPVDQRQTYRLARAATQEQREAVDTVLQEFFEATENGWVHFRCESEIHAVAGKREKASQSAKARWSKANAVPTQSERNASASEKPCERIENTCDGNAPIPNPIPNPKEDQKHLVTGVTDFASFWALYPRKTAKAEAQKAWAKLSLDHSLLELITAGLATHIACADWVKEDGKYIPHASTWLNQRRWEDSPKPAGNVVKINRHTGFDQRDYTAGLIEREDGTNGF